MRCLIPGWLLAAFIGACSTPPPRQESERMPTRSIQEVLAAHNAALLATPGVVGTAIGLCEGAPCIRVFVADSAAAARARMAPSLEGFPVRVEVQPPLRSRPAS